MGVTVVVWILVLVPLAVALQLGLIYARNRIRRRIHPPPAVTPTSGPPASRDRLEYVIGDELAAVFGTDLASRWAHLDDPVLQQETTRLAETVADRVAARAGLTERERRTLAVELPIAIRRELQAAATN